MKKIQILGRVFFRAYVIAMLILIWDNKAFYGLPLGILIGFLSEFYSLTLSDKELSNKKSSDEQKPIHPSEGEQEYSFIWYKKIESKNKTFYTQPFRTKVKANNFEEAQQKVQNFALGKMKLVIVSEDNFQETDLAKFDSFFDEMQTKMNDLFKNFSTK